MISPTRRAPLRGERHWRGAAPSEMFLKNKPLPRDGNSSFKIKFSVEPKTKNGWTSFFGEPDYKRTNVEVQIFKSILCQLSKSHEILYFGFSPSAVRSSILPRLLT